MALIYLQDILPSFDDTNSFILYRAIEDWCIDNIEKSQWRFDYSTTLCVCGIDIPGRIFFCDKKDEQKFRMVFCG